MQISAWSDGSEISHTQPLHQIDLKLLFACPAVWLLSYLVLAKGGSSIPERYVHADGGVYRGQWRAGKKHGLGVYKYPGGGEYRGRWVENLKQGPGIYYFPKVPLP